MEDDKGYGKVKLVDPDANSSLLQEIYRKLWNTSILKLCNDKTIHGDTMNSVNTTLNEYVKFIFLEFDRFYDAKEIDGQCTDKDGKLLKAIKEETLEIYYQAREDFTRKCIQENKGLDALQGGQIGFGDANVNPIKVSKALSTFAFVLHDVSLYLYFSLYDKSRASFLDTALSFSLSNLLPINITGIFILHLSLISLE